MKACVVALLSAAIACATDVPAATTLTVYVPVDHFDQFDFISDYSTRVVGKSTFYDLFLRKAHDTDRHILLSPVIVITKSAVNPGSFDIVYVNKGLNSIVHDPAFERLHTYLRTPSEKSGLLFDPTRFFHARLYDAPVSEFVIPSNYKLGDSAEIEYPAVLFVTDSHEFEKVGFTGIKNVAKFNILPTIIDPVH